MTGTWTATGSLGPINDTTNIGHTATLLPNGQVLVAGGCRINPLGGAETYFSGVLVYDPAAGSWTAINSLTTARSDHTATLLPNGKVLVAGGSDSSGPLSSGELYDWVGWPSDAWRPLISSLPARLRPGYGLELTGSRFRGLSEASGGGTNDSATDFPMVQLRRIDNDRMLWLSPDPAHFFSAAAFVSRPLGDLPYGYYLVTVFANDIPSISGITRVGEQAKRANINGVLQLLLLD